MAETTVTKVIDVKVENLESLNTLVKQVDELSKALESLDKNSGEYKDVLSQLIKSQSKISSALKGQKTETQDLEGSYNALSKKLSGLRKEWKATNDEAKRNELGGQIMEVNNELKELDKSVGSYQRNVGNYTNSIKEAFVTPRQHLKNLKDELAQLEEGTEEYNSVLRETAQVSGDLQRLNEQLRYSSADLGDVIGNVAGVAQGVIGGLGAIQGVMALFGEEDHYAETIQNLTAIMAIVQGLGALEGLRDKIKGLSDAWKGFKKSAEGSSGVMTGMNDAMKTLGGSAENATGPIGKVSNTLQGTVSTVNEASKAITAQAEALDKYGLTIEQATEKLQNYNQAMSKRGRPNPERTEEERQLVEIFGKETVELEKQIRQREIQLAQLKEFLRIDRERLALAQAEGGDTSRLKEQIAGSERRIAKMQEEIKVKTQLLKERKVETDAVQRNTQAVSTNTKANESNNKSLKEMTLIEKAATIASNGLGKALNAIGIGGKVASLAMKGLKAAITATGIGALIVLSGELINLLFKGVGALKGWISGANKAKRQADELKSAMDALNESFEATNDAVDFEVRKMEAVGKSYEEVYNYKRKYLQQQIQDTKQLMAESDAYKRFLTLTDKQKKKSKFEGIVENATELQERLKDLEKQLKRLDEDKVVHDLAENYNASKKAAEDLEKAGTKAGSSIKKSTDDAAQALKKYRDELRKTIDEYNNLITGLDRERESPIERIKREYQERMDLADRAEKAETDLLKSQLDEREISREEYERRSLEIAQKYSEGRLKIQRKETEEGKKILGQQAMESAQGEVSGIQQSYKGSEDDKKIEERIRKAQDTISKAGQKFSIWDILMGKDQGLQTYKEKLAQAEEAYNATLTNMNQDYEDKKAALKSQMDVWAQVMNDETVDDETRAKARAEYSKLGIQLQDAETENLVGNMELRAEYMKTEEQLQKEHIDNVIEYYNKLRDSVLGTISSLADYYEQDYENKKDGDEKSQRIAKRSFKKAQALRIAEATINTLNGAIGGFMQATATYPAPYGQILGAAVSAAAIASGMAQIQKIRSTQFDSSGSSLGSGGTTFQLPQIEQYEPTYTQNVTQESDTDRLMNAVSEGMSKTQLYVSVTDINNVQNKVRVTENEASW